jgi:uncharacterized phage protein (TIGR02218 family)
LTIPVDLYRLVMGTQIWTITPVDIDQYYDSGSGVERYLATPIGRGQIEQKKDLSRANLEVKLSHDHPLAVSLLTSFFEQILTLTIFTQRDATTEVAWKGRLASVEPGDAFVTLNFESIFTSLRRAGLRARFQRSCRHALYGRGCRLDPETFAVATTLAALSGAACTVPAAGLQPDGYYTGGMLRGPDNVLAFIIGHVGTSLTLQRVPYTLSTAFASTGAATAIKIYPGCDHTRATCFAKFNNRDNYGGFDWIPNNNPMAGGSIA